MVLGHHHQSSCNFRLQLDQEALQEFTFQESPSDRHALALSYDTGAGGEYILSNSEDIDDGTFLAKRGTVAPFYLYFKIMDPLDSDKTTS